MSMGFYLRQRSYTTFNKIQINVLNDLLQVYERVCGSAAIPRFQLRSARSSRTNLHRLELLASACPDLQRLSLSEPHHTPESLSLLPTTLTSLR